MKRLTTEEFIKKAQEVHGNKYNYVNVNYINNKIKVIISCPKHGNFLQQPYCHIDKQGCPKCRLEKLTYNNKKFIKKAQEVHDINKYDYSKVNYINTKTKIIILCYKHGEFSQKPSMHLMGRGCPICKSSKGELLIIKTLKNLNILYERQKTFNDLKNPKTNWKLRYDFFIPKENMLIEFNGLQHYKYTKYWNKNFETQQYKDNLKKEYAINNDYKFLVIKYGEDIEKVLKTNIRFK